MMPEDVPKRLCRDVRDLLDLTDELYAMEVVARRVRYLGISTNMWLNGAQRLNVVDANECEFLKCVLVGALDTLGALFVRVEFRD